MLIADVAVPIPLGRALSYRVPDSWTATVVPGARVVCELGTRRLLAVVLAVSDRTIDFDPGKLKPLVALVDSEPVIEHELLSFLRELASYYLAPIGEVLRLSLPLLERSQARELTSSGVAEREMGAVVGRVVSFVRQVEGVAAPTTGKAAALWTELSHRGDAMAVSELEKKIKGARAVVKRLEQLGACVVSTRILPSDPYFRDQVERDVPPELTPAQATAASAIEESLHEARPVGYLLHGVTGSGKTEVYLRAIAACLQRGRGALVLVPEIALTPQLVARFRARFGDELAVIHSGIREGARQHMWKRLRSGEVRVAVGARSALFAPVQRLGLVVVDEEHDGSFKQEEGIRYHARDMAILRAHRAGAVCVLGSATPSLETEMLTRRGKLQKLELPLRAHHAALLPEVVLVDLRRIGPGPTGDPLLSLPLHRALEQTLASREQAILFLNRRGYAPSVICEACGALVVCKLCSVSLTYHRTRGGSLRCHYCDFEGPHLRLCPECKAPRLTLEGLGTEKLEASVAAAFPTARVARLDRDVAGGSKSEAILKRVRDGEVDILVGTQMVTKGHDLPSVTLVGVLNADSALSIPDFRAAERAFQLLVQVAGRAGRGDKPGRVIVQTRDPERAAVVFASRHDVPGFIARELLDREELGYPPFAHLALLRIDAMEEQEALAEARSIAGKLRDSPAVQRSEVEVLGPAPAPIARLRGRYRFRVLLKAKARPPLRSVLEEARQIRDHLSQKIRLVIDVDPVQMM